MRIVLDTNILLVSIGSKSRYRSILNGLLNNKYELLVSNEILLEYEEIITRKSNYKIAHNILETLISLPNVYNLETYFKWKLLKDEDDNKFVDLYISGSADYLVTNDNDFNALIHIDFPKINRLTIIQFLNLLNLHE